jgi:hypothetical protein
MAPFAQRSLIFSGHPRLSKTTRKRPHQAGPYSRDEVLSRLDRRTKPGRLMRKIEGDLRSDVGGDPSTAEWLLIQAVAVKAVRLALLSERLLECDEPGEDGHHALSWLNSMRLDLCALGLQRRAKNVTPPALASHFARPFDAVAAE